MEGPPLACRTETFETRHGSNVGTLRFCNCLVYSLLRVGRLEVIDACISQLLFHKVDNQPSLVLPHCVSWPWLRKTGISVYIVRFGFGLH